MIDQKKIDFIKRIPKTELHIHLEGGTMYPDLAMELAARNGIKLPFHDDASAKSFYEFTSLDQFIVILRTVLETLNTAEDYKTITVRLGEESAQQNIHYHEVFFTYGLVSPRGVRWEDIVKGLAEGRKINKERFGVETRFVAEIDRSIEPEKGIELVKLAHGSREKAGIIAIGLDCQEIGFPPSRHQEAFKLARELGFRIVAHAGEAVGPENVWEAINLLGVERIDHGVRSIEDPTLVSYLAETRIPLTITPVSNVAIKIFPDLTSHPIKKLMDAGVLVTVNSDDPPMFETDATNDLVQVADTFNLSTDEITQIARNGFEATFMNPEEKKVALKKFDEETKKLQVEIFG